MTEARRPDPAESIQPGSASREASSVRSRPTLDIIEHVMPEPTTHDPTLRASRALPLR